MKPPLTQLTIFDQLQVTTPFPDSPPIHSEPTPEATSRIIIPRDQILAFIFSQADRLSRIYEDFEPVQKISTQTRSPFHC